MNTNSLSFLTILQRSIESNQDCNSASLWISPKAYYIEKGYFGDKDQEILALLSGCYYGYWFYGHTFKLEGRWYSVIAWVKDFIQARHIDSLFERYARTINYGLYEPCVAQEDWQTFQMCETFEEAAIALSKMIDAFSIKDRLAPEHDELSGEPEPPMNGHLDFRILDVYGFA